MPFNRLLSSCRARAAMQLLHLIGNGFSADGLFGNVVFACFNPKPNNHISWSKGIFYLSVVYLAGLDFYFKHLFDLFCYFSVNFFNMLYDFYMLTQIIFFPLPIFLPEWDFEPGHWQTMENFVWFLHSWELHGSSGCVVRSIGCLYIFFFIRGLNSLYCYDCRVVVKTIYMFKKKKKRKKKNSLWVQDPVILTTGGMQALTSSPFTPAGLIRFSW